MIKKQEDYQLCIVCTVYVVCAMETEFPDIKGNPNRQNRADPYILPRRYILLCSGVMP